MALMPQWTGFKNQFVQNTRHAVPGNKDEKPLATFKQKSLKNMESVIKAIDAAIAKPNLKLLLKYETTFHKALLDFHADGQVALVNFKNIDAKRAMYFETALKTIQGQLKDLKEEIAESRVRLQTPGEQAATKVVPPGLFDALRKSSITRDPQVIRFTVAPEFETSWADGKTRLAGATKEQGEFKHGYDSYVHTMALIDRLKSTSAKVDQIAGQLRSAFDQIEESLNKMSMATADWERAQQHSLQAAHLARPPQAAAATKARVEHIAQVIAGETHRVIQLREGIKKMFPSHFR